MTYVALTDVDRANLIPKLVRVGACLVFTGHLDNGGYGRCWMPSRRRVAKAHRIAWELARGEIPAETPHALHNCPGGDNRACCEVEHLWLGTNADNVADRVAKDRSQSMPGEANPFRKLTEAAVRDIRMSGDSLSVLARRHGVSRSTAQFARSGTTWGHIPGVGKPARRWPDKSAGPFSSHGSTQTVETTPDPSTSTTRPESRTLMGSEHANPVRAPRGLSTGGLGPSVPEGQLFAEQRPGGEEETSRI